MISLAMYQVDAFTDRVFHGNPAAVLVLDEALSDAQMLAIAEENNLAETAFVVRPAVEGGAFDLRWFTPVHEAAFCGHATLAAAHVLATQHGAKGEMVFETRQVGILRVQREGDDAYTLDLPRFDPAPLEPIPSVFAELFPNGWRAAFRNFENLFVELGDEAEVRAYKPDNLRIASLFPFGLAITAKGENAMRNGVDFVLRYFAPGAGIPEDPVTGSTHSTLAPYWAKRLGRTSLVAVQASRRGGTLKCLVASERVFLKGHAATYMRAALATAP